MTLWLIAIWLIVIAIRFWRALLRVLGWICIPPPRVDRITTRELCYACGSRKGKLDAVKVPMKSKDPVLLVRFTCATCGARQHFAPIASHEDGEFKPRQRVGAVEERHGS